MASLSKNSKGIWRLQIVCHGGVRRTIHLEKRLQKREAKSVQVWVERLSAARKSGQPVDADTLSWLNKVDPSIYKKLVTIGLAQKRDEESQDSISVEALISDYIKSRVSVKEGTRKRWETVKGHLLKHFEADKPISEVTLRDADLFAEYLSGNGLAENSKRRYLGIAKQFFNSAVRGELIEDNPFKDQKTTVNGNQKKNRFFVTKQMAEQILDTCPDAEWKLIFALMRWAGLRCPSEVQALRWSDVNWDKDRFLTRSSKTEHHEGKESRLTPIFPELLPYFEALFNEAEEGAEFVISKRHTMTHRGLIAQYRRILFFAGIAEYPKLFQNLRSTRATELMNEGWSIHVVTAWIGNSPQVALKHYLQVTEGDFEKAVKVSHSSEQVSQKVTQHVQEPQVQKRIA